MNVISSRNENTLFYHTVGSDFANRQNELKHKCKAALDNDVIRLNILLIKVLRNNVKI